MRGEGVGVLVVQLETAMETFGVSVSIKGGHFATLILVSLSQTYTALWAQINMSGLLQYAQRHEHAGSLAPRPPAVRF